jgi:tetratricopeptide (TPR) repeat protein
MEPNLILKGRMKEMGLTQEGLAESVNAFLRTAGYEGSVSDRTVRYWLTGKTRWPQDAHRAALETVFECIVEELGFVPPEGAVRRRRFIAATTGTAVAATTAAAAPRRIGTSDVERLNAKLARVIAADDRHGGSTAQEDRAVALAQETLDVQRSGHASQRVRGLLYSTAASATCSAMWAAIDGCRPENAQQHLHHAVTLAGLSADPAIQFHVWGYAGGVYEQLGRYADALAAVQAARSMSIVRRDPLFASLAHARIAARQAKMGDATAAKRSLGHAQDALDRADATAARPAWMAFYGQPELELFGVITHSSLGQPAETEAYAHRSLAALGPHMMRDRALMYAHLAHAQLAQGALEPAVESAMAVRPDIASRSGRIGKLLDQFGKRLSVTGTPEARTWADYLNSNTSAADRDPGSR